MSKVTIIVFGLMALSLMGSFWKIDNLSQKNKTLSVKS